MGKILKAVATVTKAVTKTATTVVKGAAKGAVKGAVTGAVTGAAKGAKAAISTFANTKDESPKIKDEKPTKKTDARDVQQKKQKKQAKIDAKVEKQGKEYKEAQDELEGKNTKPTNGGKPKKDNNVTPQSNNGNSQVTTPGKDTNKANKANKTNKKDKAEKDDKPVVHKNKDGTTYTEVLDEKTGKIVKKNRDEDGNLISKEVYDPATGNETTLKYDKDGNKKSKTVEKTDGTVSVTNYDTKTGNKKLTKTTKPNGDISETTYNSKNEKEKTITHGADKSETTVSYKDDKKVKSVKVDENGDTTVKNFDAKTDNTLSKQVTHKATGIVDETKYEYKDDKLTSATTTSKNKDGKTIETKDITYNADGKKGSVITKNAEDEVIADKKYNYDQKGVLTSTQETKADGRVTDATYDPSTGNKSKTVVKSPDGTTNTTTYNVKTGKKTGRTIVDKDENGNTKDVRTYTFDSDGNLKTRMKYDKTGELKNISNYSKAEDGSEIRTDFDTKGNLFGTTTFIKNEDGKTTQKISKDKDGNIKSTTNFTYTEAGVLVSKEKTNADGKPLETNKYASNGVLLEQKTHKYDKKGNEISSTHVEYDKEGKEIKREATGLAAEAAEQEITLENGAKAIEKTEAMANDLIDSLVKTLTSQVESGIISEEEANDILANLDVNDLIDNSKFSLGTATEDNQEAAIKDAFNLSNEVLKELEEPIKEAAQKVLDDVNSSEEAKADAQKMLDSLTDYQNSIPANNSSTTTILSRNTQQFVTSEITTKANGAVVETDYQYDFKTNHLTETTTIDGDGNYTRAFYIYNKDGSIASIEQTTTDKDGGNAVTIKTNYENGKVVGEPVESEYPEGFDAGTMKLEVWAKRGTLQNNL